MALRKKNGSLNSLNLNPGLTFLTLALVLTLFTPMSLCSATRFETRTYEKPKHHLKLAPNIYSIAPRQTQHSSQTESLFFVIMDEKHVEKDTLHNRKMTSDIKFNVQPPSSGCCDYISPNARVEQPLNFIIDTTNPDSLSSQFILSTFNQAVSQCESASGFDLVGSVQSGDVPFSTNVNVPDGFNTVFWAEVNEPGVIAFASTHGDFSGSDQVIFEVDIVYNTLGLGPTTSNSQVYDFFTVTLHELLHGFGLGHTPVTEICEDAVMFPSLSLGQSKVLTSDDAQCVASLYSGMTVENNANDGGQSYKRPFGIAIGLFVVMLMSLLI
jgi:hypothetical protein